MLEGGTMEQELNDINFDNYVVVGVSAGPDSMCLLNLLEKKTNKIIVCHINHNIREQSIIEEEYLKTYCQEHNLIFESISNSKTKSFKVWSAKFVNVIPFGICK